MELPHTPQKIQPCILQTLSIPLAENLANAILFAGMTLYNYKVFLWFIPYSIDGIIPITRGTVSCLWFVLMNVGELSPFPLLLKQRSWEERLYEGRVTTNHITWGHFDSCIHFIPLVHPVKLPVQDKIPIIRHHRTLGSNFPHFSRMKIQVGREEQESESNNQKHLS